MPAPAGSVLWRVLQPPARLGVLHVPNFTHTHTHTHSEMGKSMAATSFEERLEEQEREREQLNPFVERLEGLHSPQGARKRDTSGKSILEPVPALFCSHYFVCIICIVRACVCVCVYVCGEICFSA